MTDAELARLRAVRQAQFDEQAQDLFQTHALAERFAQKPPSSNPLLEVLSGNEGQKPLYSRLLDTIGEGASSIFEDLGLPAQGVRSLLTGKPYRGPALTGEDVTGLKPGPAQLDVSPLATLLLNPKQTANTMAEVLTDPLSFLPLGAAKRSTPKMADFLKETGKPPVPEQTLKDILNETAQAGNAERVVANQGTIQDTIGNLPAVVKEGPIPPGTKPLMLPERGNRGNIGQWLQGQVEQPTLPTAQDIAARKLEFGEALPKPGQPIEILTPPARETVKDVLASEQPAAQSTFEKAMQGKPLTEADHANLGAQKAFFSQQKDRLGAAPDDDLFLAPIGGGSPAPPTRMRFANPWANPAVSNSPLIRSVSEDFARSEAGFKLELPQAQKFRQDRMLAEYGDNAQLRAKAMAYVEGNLSEAEAPPQAVRAGNAWNEVKKDIARRLSLVPGNEEEARKAHFYATHLTDWDAIYASLRPQFVQAKSLKDFGGEDAGANWLRVQVGSESRFQELKKAVEANPDWASIPAVMKRDIRNLANFDTFVDRWDNLPGFFKKDLPQEAFSPYLLPRKGGVPYVHDLDEVFQRYVPTMLRKIHYDPALKKWDGVINALPGEALFGTEKGYLTKMVNAQMGRELPWDSRAIQWLANFVNDRMHKEFFKLSQAQDFATLMRSGDYRALIGPDSAIINMSQSLNDVIEHGMFLKPLYRYVENFKQINKTNGLFGDYVDQAREWAPSEMKGGVRDKVMQLDEFMSRFWLSPMAITEGFNKGVSMGGSIERAIRAGKTGNEVLVNAMAEASQLWPNPTLPDTVMQGLFKDVPKTQFTSNLAAQRTPYFRGPLGRVSTILTTYPVNQTQFLTQGFVNAIRDQDALKGLRFTVGLGAFATLPYVMASIFGIDVRRQFGMDSLLGQMTFPFWRMLRNGIDAVTGDSPLTTQKAKEQFADYWTKWALPQKRYAEKIEKVLGNIERGYAIDSYGRMLYETTPMGEILKLAGINPEEAYDARQLTKSIQNQADEWKMDRRLAIQGLLDGDQVPSMSYMQKWPERPITMQDLLREQKQRMKPPEQRALERLPKRLRGRVREQAEDEAGIPEG